MLVGAPGLLLALVVLFVMREPRHSRPVEAAAAPARLSTGDAMREIFASRAFVYLLIASSVVAFLGYGKAVWTTSVFIRSHALSTTAAWLSLAVAVGPGGVV